MGSRATHELDEVVIFLCGVTVALDIADHLGIYLAGCVETEGSLDPFVLEVAVDSLGHTDHLNVGTYILIILGKNGSVGIGVVATDDDESLDVELFYDLETLVKLVGMLELGTADNYDSHVFNCI